jgi:DNA-binding CsgD family transcriptional regulator
MERLTRGDLRRLLDAVRTLYASADLTAFRARVLSTVPQVVRSDVTGYNEVDPEQGQVTGRIEPVVGDVGTVLRDFARHMHEHPVLGHVRRTGDGSARKISDFLTARQFRRRGLYREFYRPLGIEHQIAISLPISPALVIGIALNRRGRDFSERDRLLLDLLRPHVVQAYANAETVSRLQARLARTGGEESCGVILVDGAGRVRHATEAARRRLEDYFGKGRDPSRLPDRLERWVTHQRSQLAPADDGPLPRAALVIDRPGKRLIVRLLSEPSGDEHHLVLEEQRAGGGGGLVPSWGLTPREAEVLRWVAQGKTNREIAIILSLSPLTVRTHLEHIFRKIGVETRTAAAIRALEATDGADRSASAP